MSLTIETWNIHVASDTLLSIHFGGGTTRCLKPEVVSAPQIREYTRKILSSTHEAMWTNIYPGHAKDIDHTRVHRRECLTHSNRTSVVERKRACMDG